MQESQKPFINALDLMGHGIWDWNALSNEVFFSNEWKKQAEPQMKCLANQSQQPLSQDNLFPTLLSLLDVKTQVIDPKNDMLATCAHS